MLESAPGVIQASLNPESGEIKVLPSAPKPPDSPSPVPAAVPDQAAAQTPSQDVPAATAPKPDQFSKGFAAMAKKDRELRARQAQLRQMEQQIQEREAQIARFEQLKLQNPIEAMKALGLTYEDVTNFQLNGGQNPTAEMEIKNIKQQMQEYVRRQEAEKQAILQRQQQAQQQQVQQTLNTFKAEVADFVKSKPDEFELTNMEGDEAYDLIASTVEQHFYQTQQIMPKEQAAKLVEEYLTQDAEKKRMAKKFQQQVQPAKSGQPSEPGFQTKSAMDRASNALSGPRPTLNNTMTGSTPSIVAPRIENDRMQRAIAALSK
jgi:hypothetical protein